MSDLRPFAKRPLNRTIHPELQAFRFADDYRDEGGAVHVFVRTADGGQQVLPLTDQELAHHFEHVAAMVARRFKKQVADP